MIKDPNGVVIIADCSALELRAAAAMGTPLPQRTTELLDVHKLTAALRFNVKFSDVTPEQRKEGKRLNFHALYSPGVRWQAPDEQVFRALYTDDEWVQLCGDLGVARPSRLYEAVKDYLNRGRT